MKIKPEIIPLSRRNQSEWVGEGGKPLKVIWHGGASRDSIEKHLVGKCAFFSDAGSLLEQVQWGVRVCVSWKSGRLSTRELAHLQPR